MNYFKLLAASGVLIFSACSGDTAPEPLDSGLFVLKVDPFSVTLSGLSSGAYMAQQLHFAHSERVRGVALLGGGPYDCAQGDLAIAVGECMFSPAGNFGIGDLIALVEKRAQSRDIQPLANLRGDHIWLFRGQSDPLTGESVFMRAVELYKHFADSERLTVEQREGVGHLWPTKGYGVDCDSSESPYLGNCDYDVAGALLEALYGFMHDPAEQAGELIEFDQKLAAGGYADSLAQTGYAYIPEDCANGERCSLHISFHGCEQNSAAVGDTFVRHNGLNEWAETNRIVVLYPQTKDPAGSTVNPQGCWDWWGYTGEEYATRDGIQIEAVVRMINHIAGVDTPEEIL